MDGAGHEGGFVCVGSGMTGCSSREFLCCDATDALLTAKKRNAKTKTDILSSMLPVRPSIHPSCRRHETAEENGRRMLLQLRLTKGEMDFGRQRAAG